VDGHRPALTANRLDRWVLPALAAPVIVLVAVFYAFPVASLAQRSLSADAFRRALQDDAIRRVAWFTAWQAAVSTALTVVVGMVPAWLLARHSFRGRRVVSALVTLPFILPTVVVGSAFLALLPDGHDRGVVAIVAAHVYFNIAVVVRGVGGFWQQVPVELTHAARTLGASPWRTMREVTLPLLAPAIWASASIVALFTFTSFGVVRILGGPARPTLEVEIWQRATRLGDIGVAAALSLLQLGALGATVIVFARLQARRRHALALRTANPPRRVRGPRERALVALCAAGTVAAVVVPLVALAERSLRTSARGHSLAAWRALFGERPAPASRPGLRVDIDAGHALATSLRFAGVATIVAVVVGTLAAVAIARAGRAGRVLDAGVMLPLGTSAVTIGFGLLIAFDTPPFDWRAAWWMIPLGHALIATPFVVRLLLPALRAIDPRQRAAAATLGTSPLRALAAIDLAVVRRPVATAAAFAFAISLGEFGATTFLTRRNSTTLPIAVESLLSRPGALLHAEGYALATLLAGVTLVVVLLVELLGTERA
jgi:thiamine transport system permease protein